MTGWQKGGLVVLGVGVLAGAAVLLKGKPKSRSSRGLGHGKTGPGKFQGGMEALKKLLYTASLDTSWLDEQESADGDRGWCGLMRGPISLTQLQKQNPEEFSQIDDEDVAEITKAKGGAILCEDSQGFVEVDLFTSKKEAEKQWKKVEKSFG
jgi:hypothetical protein